MKPERLQQIEQLCHAALQREKSEQGAFLDWACAGDEALRREVESLLAYNTQAEHFIETPAMEVAAQALVNSELMPGAPLQLGPQFGRYHLLEKVGEGGMGEVYRARDTRLDRTVAIKILPDRLASRTDLRERFEREARTIASLNHPHICTLYDIGQQDGINFLVMEYLEGETLAERLKKGSLPLEQVLQYAIEIADALDKAHGSGITHRDLKPSNIMLSRSGAKLLDFGLAKLRQTGPTAQPSEVSTERDSITPQGIIVGTLRYMAPEQIEAREVDARTDIFAFGVVIYEMATGKRAFDGKSQASLIAKILETDPPPVSSLRPMTSPAFDRVVKKCLAKEPEKRWQSATDLCDELKWIAESGSRAAVSTAAASPALKNWRKKLVSAAGVLAACAIVGLAVWNLKPAPVRQAVSRLVITLPAGQRLAALDQPALAISSDGKNIVYVAVEAGTQRLFLRPLGSQEAKPIAGTEGAVAPFFSPDGHQVGFFADGKLKKVSVDGGVAVTIASAPGPGGASWSSEGIVALQPAAGRSLGLQQVSQEGGPPQPLTQVGGGAANHGWPEFLPGRKAVLFAYSATFGAWNNAQIAVQEAGAGERKYPEQTGTQPRYAATGHLLYVQNGTLMAAPFDARRLAVTGAAVPAVEGVMESLPTGAAQYSISATGTLVYLAGGVVGSQSRLVWVSRKGEEQALPAVPHNYQFPRISPDARRVSVTIAEQEQQVWVYDSSRETLTRLTFEGSTNNNATWSPDGRRIAFGSNQMHPGPNNLFWIAADGSGGADRLTTSDYTHSPNSFSADGQVLAFVETKPETGRDIWVLRLSDRKAQPLLQTPSEETAPKFSPDGRWLAYSSNESGRREIYVQAYPGPGGKWQISTDGGQEPVWNPRGGELFFRSGSRIMVVDVDTKSSFSAGRPRMLFEGPYLPTGASFPYYDVSPDGQRFLMLKPVASQTSVPTQINVVLNWFEELKRRLPADK